MITLTSTSSRSTILNHLRQSVATLQSTQQFHQPMEVHFAVCAIEQSYHLSIAERRRAIMSARYTAAQVAPLDTLSAPLQAWREGKRRAEQERADAIASWQKGHAEEVQAKAARLTATEIAELPVRIAHHFDVAENGTTGKSGRKRHRQAGRALQEILDAAVKA